MQFDLSHGVDTLRAMVRTRPRPVARILVADASDRLLLFHSRLAYGTFWLTPGGGVEPGETYEEAAVRELWEETGMVITDPGPCIWTTRFSFEYEGETYDQTERYFLLRADSTTISTANWQHEERGEIQEYRWWALEEIAVSAERFRPRMLATLARDLFLIGPLSRAMPVEA